MAYWTLQQITNIRPELTFLDEEITKIIKTVTDAYNTIQSSDLCQAPNSDLQYIRKIIEVLRCLLCAILHNETPCNTNDTTRQYWLETHHNITIIIREHTRDFQTNKIPIDFENIHQQIQKVFQACHQFLKTLLQAELQQIFYVRISLYRYHIKALQMHCTLYDTYFKFLENAKTQNTEQTRIEIMKRQIELYQSFKDEPHPLQTKTERPEHPDFTRFL